MKNIKVMIFSKLFDRRLVSIVNVILFLAVFLLLYCFQNTVSSKSCRVQDLDISNLIILSIGFVGLFNWIYVCLLSIFNRSSLDRSMANANVLRLTYILLLVISIPCILYCGYVFVPIGLTPVDSFNDFNEFIVNPFLNHGGYEKGITPSLISLLGTFFLSGVLVSMLVSFLSQRSEKWEKGELRYTFRFCNYCVVIGGHDSTPSLVRQLVSKYDKVNSIYQ